MIDLLGAALLGAANTRERSADYDSDVLGDYNLGWSMVGATGDGQSSTPQDQNSVSVGRAITSADLTVGPATRLTSVGTSTTTADLADVVAFSAASNGSSFLVSGGEVDLAGTSAGSADCLTDIYVGEPVLLEGSSTGSSDASGVLSQSVPAQRYITFGIQVGLRGSFSQEIPSGSARIVKAIERPISNPAVIDAARISNRRSTYYV